MVTYTEEKLDGAAANILCIIYYRSRSIYTILPSTCTGHLQDASQYIYTCLYNNII